MRIDLKAGKGGKVVVLISHSDLDGCGCVILGKARFGASLNWYCCEYRNVNERINDVLDYLEDQEVDLAKVTFIISDISPDSWTAERLNMAYYNGLGLKLYDHHKTAEWLETYEWAMVVSDDSHCGTSLVYRELIDGHDEDVEIAYSGLTRLIKDYDLWNHKFQESKHLNRLLFIIGRDKFIERFSANADTQFTPIEVSLIEYDIAKEDRYFKRATRSLRIYHDKEGRRFGVTTCDQYTSSIGHKLVHHNNLDYVLLLDLMGGKVSLRSKDADVSEIAEKLGGGGHKFAAGFSYDFRGVYDVAAELMG